jgi:proteasome alpha subunit
MVEIQSPDMLNKMAYDRAIVVFSPEGRLYQVEYAQKAVENAPTALGITFKNGIVLLATKTVTKLLIPESSEKISKIDNHIAIAFCGMAADARVLIDYARIRAQINRITYNEPITTHMLAKLVANRKQQFTQVGGIRPFGISFLIGGVDESEHLFETDPAGTIREWYAYAIGRGAKTANEILEKEWRTNMNRESALLLGAKVLKTAEKKVTFKNVEAAIIEDGKFERIPQEVLKKYF